MPSCAICVSSSTSTATPASPAIAAARTANSRGVSVLPGSLASLARQVAALAEHPSANDSRQSPRFAASSPSAATTVQAGGRQGRRAPVSCSCPPSNSASVSPSAIACAMSAVPVATDASGAQHECRARRSGADAPTARRPSPACARSAPNIACFPAPTSDEPPHPPRRVGERVEKDIVGTARELLRPNRAGHFAA